MNAEQIRNSWDDDHDVTQPCAFPKPLAEVLTRENRELRAEIERLHGIEFIHHGCQIVREKDNAYLIARAERAEAELADATTAAQNLRDELQGAQERLRRVRELADNWGDKGRSGRMSGSGLLAVALAAVADDLRAALDAEP